jgi:hypothetical protein
MEGGMRIPMLMFLAAVLVPAGGWAQAAGWRLTMQLVSGSPACDEGDRGSVSIARGTLSFFHQGEPFARWTVPLAADGSAQARAKALSDKLHLDYVRVTVPAGTGPREIAMLTEESACRYRLIPD